MIQFKRGSTRLNSRGETIDGSWSGVVLQDGQPGYDKRSNRLKIGDGETPWNGLKWLKSGIEANQVLDSEANAKARLQRDAEDLTVFTYGNANPDDQIVGKVYLQQYNGLLETDFVVEYGNNGIWQYRKWNSGLAECWGFLAQQNTNKAIEPQQYPFTFLGATHFSVPLEQVSLNSNIAGSYLLANGTLNSTSRTGAYLIQTPENVDVTSGVYYINFYIRGFYA